jgi:hypothetical protein
MFYLVFIVHAIRKTKCLFEFYIPADLSTIYPLEPLISSYQKKKNAGHQQQLLAMSNKSSTSFVPIQNKK